MITKSLNVLGAALLAASAVSAQNLTVPTHPTEIPGPAARPSSTLSLNLEQAYAMALTRNLDLQVGRYDVAASTAGILGQTGVFDPLLSASVRSTDTTSPTSSDLEGADVLSSRSSRFALGLAQVLPTGTQLSLDASTVRSETNNVFVFFNPSWTTDVSLSLTQPLLRGFGTTVNRSGIVIARNIRDQNVAAFESQVTAVLREVEYAYWDYVAAQRAVDVAQQSLDLATRLLNETRERVNVGTSAPIDIIQSESGVATRRQDVIVASNSASNAQDQLKSQLGFDRPEEWTATIQAVETYDFRAVRPVLAESIQTALSQRPEIVQKRLDLERLELNVDVARNTTLPSLNLTGRYGLAGIGGDLYDVDQDTGERMLIDPGGFSDSFSQVTGTDFPNWAIGLFLSVPIGNHEAKAAVAQRRFEYEQGVTELKRLEQQIILQVRTAVRALEDGAAEVEAAAAATEFARRNLEAEQTKFANGLSTNFQVLQIQEDLALAQLSEIRARLKHRKAWVGYLEATAQLLDQRSVEIADAGQPEIPHDYWKDVRWMQFTDLQTAAEQVTVPPPPVSSE